MAGNKQVEREIRVQKELLDAFFEETLEIERMQMHEKDPELLKKYLEDVTRTKLHALEELTHEDLRDDRIFQIFLTECANLTRKIQSKLALSPKGEDE